MGQLNATPPAIRPAQALRTEVELVGRYVHGLIGAAAGPGVMGGWRESDKFLFAKVELMVAHLFCQFTPYLQGRGLWKSINRARAGLALPIQGEIETASRA